MRPFAALLVAGVIGVGAVHAAAAGDLSGDASLSGAFSGPGHDNAKFREYRTDMHSAFAVMPQGSVSWATRVGEADIYMNGEFDGWSGLKGVSHDGDAEAEVGSWGLFRLSGSFKRIGHNFATGARSLYDGIGTGELRFADPSLQPTMTAVSATNYKASTLNRFVDSAELVNLGLRRDIVNVGLDVAATAPVSVGINIMGEKRRGTQPYSVSFGMGNALEIAKPIDWDTVDVSARAGYAETVPVAGGLPVAAEVTAGHSGFANNIPTVLFENPGGNVSMSNTYSGLPLAGSSSLEPSNRADRASLSLTAGLPCRMGFSGHASIARMTQDSALPSMTINPSLFYTAPSQLTAGMKVIQGFCDAALTLTPVDRVHLKVRGSYRQHDNQSPRYRRFGTWVNYDSSVSTSSATSVAVSSIERIYEFEQVFSVTRHTRVTSAFEHERSSFVNGSSDAMRQSSFRLAVDTRAFEWATVRISGLHAVRDSAYPDYTLADGELPWMRKYYAADRDRDRLTVMSSIAAADDLDISVEHTEGLDDYKHSLFGLQKDSHRASTVDATWAPDDGLLVSTFVSQEEYVTNQRSRQWSPDAKSPGAGNPYSASPSVEDAGNWTVESATVVRTVGLRTDMQVVPERLLLRIEGAASVANGRLDYSSVLSTTVPIDSNMWLPEDVAASDETKSINAGLSLRYQVTKAVWASLVYRYDLWQVRDDLMDGYTPVAENRAGAYNGMVSMDTLYKSYEVHSIYASVGTTF